jgi:fucose permease
VTEPAPSAHGALDDPAGAQLLRLSYLGFVSLGLPDTVLGAAWPALRAELGLPLDAAGALLLVTTAGVVLSSAASGAVRLHLGTGVVLVGSTLLASGALLASALAQHWPQLLGAAFVAGLGGGAIDASLNDHVARHYPARQLSWLHACWGVGAAIAPLVVASVLATGASWRWAYGGLALLEGLLALAFWRTAPLWRATRQVETRDDEHEPAGALLPKLAGVLLFYVYGGLEASTGLWTASLLTATRGTSRAAAGAAVALFWGSLTFGRIAVGLRADALGPLRVLRLAIWLALLSSCALALPSTPAWFVMLALVGLGLALAPVYPLAMHDTPTRFGARAGARLVGYQVAAASVGVATLPWLVGSIAESTRPGLLPAQFVLLAAALVGLQWARKR